MLKTQSALQVRKGIITIMHANDEISTEAKLVTKKKLYVLSVKENLFFEMKHEMCTRDMVCLVIHREHFLLRSSTSFIAQDTVSCCTSLQEPRSSGRNLFTSFLTLKSCVNCWYNWQGLGLLSLSNLQQLRQQTLFNYNEQQKISHRTKLYILQNYEHSTVSWKCCEIC